MGRLKFFWVKGKNRPPGPYRVNKQYIDVNQESLAGAKGQFYAYLGFNPDLTGKTMRYRIYIHEPMVRAKFFFTVSKLLQRVLQIV